MITHVTISYYTFKILAPRGVRTKQRTVIEILSFSSSRSLVDIHLHLKNVYGDSTIDVSTVRRWAKHFKSGETNIDDKFRSGRPATAVTPER